MRRLAVVTAVLGLCVAACGSFGRSGARAGGPEPPRVRSVLTNAPVPAADRSGSRRGATKSESSAKARSPRARRQVGAFRCPCPDLAPGSDPRVLPGPILIADHLNNRLEVVEPNGSTSWTFPEPGDLAPGQSFLVPDDSFFTPDGRYIVATQEDDFVISLISVAKHRIVWQYGTPGVPGSGPNQLWNPDDAMMMPNGDIITADIKNCRVLILRPPLHVALQVYGTTTTACEHDPPLRWGSPNGAFPLSDGRYLVTEINGDWVDSLGLNGQVAWSTHPPGVAYPSDSNEVNPGVYLTVDFSSPGQIVEFDQSGQLLWRFAPPGASSLNHPSLALPLPNGDILANDDYNDRVIVVDPRSDAIVWQYGHTGLPGTAPGYLDDPDGVDFAPPRSLTEAHAVTMGQYPVPAGSPAAPGARRRPSRPDAGST